MHKPLVILLACLAVTACDKAPPPAEALRPVKVLKIAASAAPDNLVLAGEVRARFEAPLAFRVAGKVIERQVNLGDHVRRGQVLGRLEATDYQLATDAQAAAVAGAKTELALAEADLTRYRALRDKGFISAAELDRRLAAADGAAARLKAAEAAHAEGRRQVGHATLVADGDGVVTWLDFNAGQVIAAGQPVLKLARPGEREIEVHVAENDLARVTSGTDFLITLNAPPAQAFPGKLRELAAAADPATRTYAARIALTAPPQALSLNMSATARLHNRSAPVMRLPLAAVVSRDGTPQVWKLDAATSTVRAAKITTGGTAGNDWLVSDGLNPGETVVVAGANLLHEGQKVRALP
jgi:RND family efflux transporter MFP subunit